MQAVLEWEKVELDVHAKFSKSQGVIPLSFIWEDGVEYEIERAKFLGQAAARKVGGIGMLFEGYVLGKRREFYYDPGDDETKFGIWFVQKHKCPHHS